MSGSLALTPAEKWLAEKEQLTYTVLDDGRRMIEVSEEITKRAIMLGPISNIIQVDRNWSPQLRPMRVTVGKDTFKVASKKVGDGWEEVHDLEAPTWARLGKLSGIERVKTETLERWDGGVKIRVTARMRQADGLWEYTAATRTAEWAVEEELHRIDLVERAEKFKKPAPSDREIRKEWLRKRVFLEPGLETKAYARCVKALLGRRTFLKSELESKPFMAIAWVMTPDLNDAGSRELVRMQYAGAAADLYGSGDDMPEGSRWIAAGELDVNVDEETGEVLDAREHADEAPEEPETVDGHVVEELEDEPAEPEEKPPKPDGSFVLPESCGEWAGKSIEEAITQESGRREVAAFCKRSKRPNNRGRLLAWLSFSAGKEVTMADLEDSQ